MHVTWNSTLAMVPSLSVALAVIAIADPVENFALFIGEAIATVGDALLLPTEIAITPEVLMAP